MPDSVIDMYGPHLKDSRLQFKRSHGNLEKIYQKFSMSDPDLLKLSWKTATGDYNDQQNFKEFLKFFLEKLQKYIETKTPQDNIDNLIFSYKELFYEAGYTGDPAHRLTLDTTINNRGKWIDEEEDLAQVVHSLIYNLLGFKTYSSILSNRFNVEFKVNRYTSKFNDIDYKEFLDIVQKINLSPLYKDIQKFEGKALRDRRRLMLDYELGGYCIEFDKVKFDLLSDLELMERLFYGYRRPTSVSHIDQISRLYMDKYLLDISERAPQKLDFVLMFNSLKGFFEYVFNKIDKKVDVLTNKRRDGNSFYYKEREKLSFLNAFLTIPTGTRWEILSKIKNWLMSDKNSVDLLLSTTDMKLKDSKGVLVSKFEITLYKDDKKLNDPLLLPALTFISQLPVSYKKRHLLDKFTKQDLKLLIGDSMEKSENLLYNKLKELLDSSQMNYPKIHYRIYDRNPTGYIHIPQAEGGFGEINDIKQLDSMVEQFLIEAFASDRLVLIGDPNENFVYGFNKEGFKRPQDLFSGAAGQDERIYASYFTSSVSFYLQQGLNIDDVTRDLNKEWLKYWSDNTAINSQGDIWFNFWLYNKLFYKYWF